MNTNMSICLRDYQIECLEVVLNMFENGIKQQLIILPTGSGKTIIMAAIAKQFTKKTLLLAHREELITQAVDKIKLFWPEVDIGICMADQDDIGCQVVVGSIQSCSKEGRLDRLKEQSFQLLMIDEAHHRASRSYQTVIRTLGFLENEKKLLLGVTATPERSDKLELGGIFPQTTFRRSISNMIKGGYLSPVIGRKIQTSFSLNKIKSSNGDFAITDLSEAVNMPERNAFIVSKFKEYAIDRKGIAFCCDVQHCKDIAGAFKAAGIASTAVWGEMESKERKEALEAFKCGQIQVVTSCGILTEGYDEPSVNVIIMARPTKSTSLFTQCIGRGLRLCPGKENCLVLDFTDKHHTLDGLVSLSSAVPEAVVIEDKPKVKQEKIDHRPKIRVLQEYDHIFDILGSSTRFIWVSVEDEWSLQDDDGNEVVMFPVEGGYAANLYSPDGSSRRIASIPLSLECCRDVCEDYARRYLRIAFANVDAPWVSASAQPTQGQKNCLEKYGTYREGMTKAEAFIEIRKAVALKNKKRRQGSQEPITNKQKYCLMTNGVNIENMTKSTATQIISKIKAGVKYG